MSKRPGTRVTGMSISGSWRNQPGRALEVGGEGRWLLLSATDAVFGNVARARRRAVLGSLGHKDSGCGSARPSDTTLDGWGSTATLAAAPAAHCCQGGSRTASKLVEFGTSVAGCLRTPSAPVTRHCFTMTISRSSRPDTCCSKRFGRPLMTRSNDRWWPACSTRSREPSTAPIPSEPGGHGHPPPLCCAAAHPPPGSAGSSF